MDELISEIEAYADARGVKPATVLQYAVNLSGKTWAQWKNGGECRMSTASRIREFIQSNPPSLPPERGS